MWCYRTDVLLEEGCPIVARFSGRVAGPVQCPLRIQSRVRLQVARPVMSPETGGKMTGTGSANAFMQ